VRPTNEGDLHDRAGVEAAEMALARPTNEGDLHDQAGVEAAERCQRKRGPYDVGRLCNWQVALARRTSEGDLRDQDGVLERLGPGVFRP